MENLKEKNPAAVALGRLGGLKGGNARAESLSPERRKEIALKAALVRWSNKTDNFKKERKTNPLSQIAKLKRKAKILYKTYNILANEDVKREFNKIMDELSLLDSLTPKMRL